MRFGVNDASSRLAAPYTVLILPGSFCWWIMAHVEPGVLTEVSRLSWYVTHCIGEWAERPSSYSLGLGIGGVSSGMNLFSATAGYIFVLNHGFWMSKYATPAAL